MPPRLALCLLGLFALSFCFEAQGGHEELACGECHVTHRTPGAQLSTRGLWNVSNISSSAETVRPYSSPRFDALNTDIGQPDGTSKLCLGCHDGSYSGLTTKAFGMSDLARSHPVSFTYDSALASRVRGGRLNDPRATASGLGGTIDQDLLDDQSKMQCTSCHDVHSKEQGNSLLKYEYKTNGTDDGRMCRVCHNL